VSAKVVKFGRACQAPPKVVELRQSVLGFRKKLPSLVKVVTFGQGCLIPQKVVKCRQSSRISSNVAGSCQSLRILSKAAALRQRCEIRQSLRILCKRSGLVEVVSFGQWCRVVAKVVKFRQGLSNLVNVVKSRQRTARFRWSNSCQGCRILWNAVNSRKSCQMLSKVGWWMLSSLSNSGKAEPGADSGCGVEAEREAQPAFAALV
jgi:hypothetical protein